MTAKTARIVGLKIRGLKNIEIARFIGCTPQNVRNKITQKKVECYILKRKEQIALMEEYKNTFLEMV